MTEITFRNNISDIRALDKKRKFNEAKQKKTNLTN